MPATTAHRRALACYLTQAASTINPAQPIAEATLELRCQAYRWLYARLLSDPTEHEPSVIFAELAESLAGLALVLGPIGASSTMPMASTISSTARSVERKLGGRYYTPGVIADYLTDRAFLRLRGANGRLPVPTRVIDPACGAGRFLVAAFDRLLAESSASAAPAAVPASAALDLLRASIFGLDLDPAATLATKLALWLKLQTDPRVAGAAALGQSPGDAEATLAANIRVADALADPQTLTSAELDLAFDLAIGNPPFLSFSGRQAVHRPLVGHRPSGDLPGAWPSAHGLFVEAILRQLAPRVVALVLPAQVGQLAGYTPLRATIDSQSSLVEVRYWGERAFTGAITPVLTFVADRRHTGPAVIEDESGASGARQSAGTANTWVGHRADDAWAAALLARISEHAESLGGLVGDPGVHTGNSARELIVPLAEALPGDEPILEGRQVRRYECSLATKALRVTHEATPGQYFTIRPAVRYADVPFVIRQTAGYPIVGPRLGATYFRNSLLALNAPAPPNVVASGKQTEGASQPAPDRRAHMLYFVGLLNSALLRFIYRRVVAESRQLTFPQVKVGSLRQLPIHPVDFGHPRDALIHDQIVSVVASRLACLPGSQHDVEKTGETDDRVTGGSGGARIRLERSIDALVYELYGISASETERIEAELAAAGLSTEQIASQPARTGG